MASWCKEVDKVNDWHSLDEISISKRNEDVGIIGGEFEEEKVTIKDVMSDEHLMGVRSFFFPMKDKIMKKHVVMSRDLQRVEGNACLKKVKSIGEKPGRIEKFMMNSSTEEDNCCATELNLVLENQSIANEKLRHLLKIRQKKTAEDKRSVNSQVRDDIFDAKAVDTMNSKCLKLYQVEVDRYRNKIASLNKELIRSKLKANKSEALENQCKDMHDRISELRNAVDEKEAMLQKVEKNKGMVIRTNGGDGDEIDQEFKDLQNGDIQRENLAEKGKDISEMQSQSAFPKQRGDKNTSRCKNLPITKSSTRDEHVPIENVCYEMKEAKKLLKHREDAIKVLTTDTDQMKYEFEQTTSKLVEMIKDGKRKLKVSEVEKGNLEKSLELVEADNSCLRDSLQKTEAENEKLKDDLDEMLKEYDALKERCKSKLLKDKVLRLEQINSSLELMVKTALTNHSELKEEYEKLLKPVLCPSVEGKNDIDCGRNCKTKTGTEIEDEMYQGVSNEKPKLQYIANKMKAYKPNSAMEQLQQQNEILRKQLKQMEKFEHHLEKVVNQNSELEMKLSNVTVYLEETLEKEEKARDLIKELKKKLRSKEELETRNISSLKRTTANSMEILLNEKDSNEEKYKGSFFVFSSCLHSYCNKIKWSPGI